MRLSRLMPPVRRIRALLLCVALFSMMRLVALAPFSGGTGRGPDAPTQAAVAPPPQPVVLSPLAVSVIAPPHPVLGADNRVHLVYELVLINQTSSFVTVNAVDALDPRQHNAVIYTLRGARLAALLRLNGGVGTCDCLKRIAEAPGTTLGPSHSGYLFMDVSLAKGARVPSSLTHRFSLRVRAAPGTGAPQTLTFVGVPTLVVVTPAVAVAPPLEASGWVVVNGCCAQITGHRGATLSINGTVHLAQRFAIDFVQLNTDGRLFTGDATKLTSYAYFGTRVHAVADGVVVGTQDGQPEQVPTTFPTKVTGQTVSGNYVVEDIGHGHFAFYAHMQPGSLRVKTGDRVRQGQVLGLLGNSGNTNAPHLHFHVMDGPSPLLSNGLPYVFTSFVGQGAVNSSVDTILDGAVVPIDRSTMSGPHHDELPLNLEVVSFPKMP